MKTFLLFAINHYTNIQRWLRLMSAQLADFDSLIVTVAKSMAATASRKSMIDDCSALIHFVNIMKIDTRFFCSFSFNLPTVRIFDKRRQSNLFAFEREKRNSLN